MICVYTLIVCMIPETVCLAKKKNESTVSVLAQSYVLIEKETGEIICEKNKDKELMPASITKIMTLLLIFEEVDAGKITYEDQVTVSEHAASMGGSQVYLEAGETQTVHDMLKCITISSANDACVAMAEYIAGSEEEFVQRMNEKATELGMKHTHFMNCCGLDDQLTEQQHYSSAYDIALMSRELLLKHDKVKELTTIWMDTIIHRTRKGEKEFGLSNTNKLVRTYDGITGLKTGSTSKAKFCLSASAERNGMELIAVVMASPRPTDRFQDAAALLNYGFANCSLYRDEGMKKEVRIAVKNGKKDELLVEPDKHFIFLCDKEGTVKQIEKKIIWKKSIEAPIKKGETVGKIKYYLGKDEIGNISLLAKEKIEQASYKDYVCEMVARFLMKKEKKAG